MRRDRRRERLQGVVVSVLTPCNARYEIDYAKLKEHIRWIVNSGVREGTGVIMAAGGVGEGYFLSFEEHRRVMEALVEAADGKVPTMTGVFELSTRSAVERIKYAERVGVDFIQLNPPHYMKPSDEDVFIHYKMINDATGLGIMVYNTPWCTQGYEITPELLNRLTPLENLVAVKWSSFDVNNFLRGLRLFADKFNFIDNQGLFSLGYMLGMKGFISFIGNFAPKVELHLWELLKQRKYEEFNEEWARTHFDPFAAITGPEEQAWSGVGEGTLVKAMMEAVGNPFGPPFPPQVELTKDKKEKLRKAYIKAGIIKG